jgi:hypothetical protein
MATSSWWAHSIALITIIALGLTASAGLPVLMLALLLVLAIAMIITSVY